MVVWDMWKKGFYAWEDATAKVMESVLKSPKVLRPSSVLLTATMKAKTASDRAATLFWGSLGLPTKRDQERTLHALNQLESRLMDLEETVKDRGQS